MGIYKSIFSMVIVIIFFILPSSSATSELENNDPYTEYENVFTKMFSEPSPLGLGTLGAHLKAHSLYNSADEELKADYKYFNQMMQGVPIINPYFIAYLFSQEYKDDPRYDLEFLKKKAEEWVLDPILPQFLDDAPCNSEGSEQTTAGLSPIDCIFSFPHLVMGYRGRETAPYILEQWLESYDPDSGTSVCFGTALRASGAAAMPYIKKALTEKELNKAQAWNLIYLLNEMAGPEMLRVIPGTPFVVDEEERREIGEFMFDYFFEHPYEKAGWTALWFCDDYGFEPDANRLFNFLKTEENPIALSRAIHILRGHIESDDERLIDILPIAREWLADEQTNGAGFAFIGLITDAYKNRMPEPYASAFYPNIYNTFMTTDDEDIAWDAFCTLYAAYQELIFDEWNTDDTKRLASFWDDFGTYPSYVYLLQTLAQTNDFNLSFTIEDITEYISNPMADIEGNADIKDRLDIIPYYIEILIDVSSYNPREILGNLGKLHYSLEPLVDLVDLERYPLIIQNLEKNGFDDLELFEVLE